MVKFPKVGGIGVLRGNQAESQEIYEIANRSANVQGIRKSDESREGTRSTNTSDVDRSASTLEGSRSADVHNVSIIHGGDDVHNICNIMIKTIEVKINEVRKFDELDPRGPVAKQHGELVKELIEVPLFDEELDKTCKIGSALTG